MPDFEQPDAPHSEPAYAEPVAETVAIEAIPGPSDTELAALREEAREGGYHEGYENGYTEGKSAADRELGEHVLRLQTIMEQLATPLELLDQSMEQSLAQLVATISRHLIYRELSLNEGQIISVVRETVGLLPIAERQVTLHLNPEDAVLVRDALALDVDQRPWSIVDDPLLTRGGCRVVSGPSQIDATVESRVNRLLARLMGDRRQEDDPVSPDGED